MTAILRTNAEICNDLAAATDEALVARARAGSMPAFAMLHDRYQSRVFNFVRRRSAGADAEDLTQETFLRAWERLETYQPSRRFSTWLFTIALRLAIDAHRAAAAGRRASAALSLRSSEPRDHLTPDHLDGACNLWSLADAVLTRDQHVALWLRYAEDLSVGEIAIVMNRTSISVRVLLHRARAALAACLPDAKNPEPMRVELAKPLPGGAAWTA